MECSRSVKAIIFILECTASTIGSSLRTFVVNKAFSAFCQSDIYVHQHGGRVLIYIVYT